MDSRKTQQSQGRGVRGEENVLNHCLNVNLDICLKIYSKVNQKLIT